MKTTKAPITTEFFKATAVINWLTTQPLDRVFSFVDSRNCLFASFAKERLKCRSVNCSTRFININGTEIPLPFAESQVILDISECGFTVRQAIKALVETF